MSSKKVFVAGHNGMVGSALVRRFARETGVELIKANKSELNLLSQSQVEDFFDTHQPEEVYLAAARVGGIHANNAYPVEFLYENLSIQNNVITAAHRNQVNKLLFLGSSCIYPKQAEQPMREKSLLSDSLEPTNEAYAIAKIAGLKLCDAYRRQYGKDFRAVMPTNLYGQYDNFHPINSHVIPGLIRRIHEAQQEGSPAVTIWGSGMPRREFIHVDDMADACVFVMNMDKEDYETVAPSPTSFINVGTGSDCSIKELARSVADTIGYEGEFRFDESKPDGTPKKLLDVSRLSSLGWSAKIPLEQGLMTTYQWYVNNIESLRG
ncbi:MAG: GDP-L-fucose synthase [Pseudomonadota bacterium]